MQKRGATETSKLKKTRHPTLFRCKLGDGNDKREEQGGGKGKGTRKACNKKNRKNSPSKKSGRNCVEVKWKTKARKERGPEGEAG